MTAKEIINDFKENYGKVRKLLDEDSKNDPENNPYMSKYKAKEILINIRDSLTQLSNSEPSFDKIKLDAMLGTVLVNIGIIDMETEEMTASEKVLTEAEELLTPNSEKPEIVITLISAYNNLATLSQFFAEQNGFFQSRHHLAAASKILEQYELSLLETDNNDEAYLAKMETFKHRSADVARCWAKYCLLLMTASKARLMNDAERLNDAITDMSNLELEDTENICGGDMKQLVFADLDVAKYESKVTDKFLLTYADAREVFFNCQNWLNKAKEYYKLDTLASDYIELIQDSSQSYAYLAFFEEDDERRAKMHKRRIDMLEDLIKEINPTYYLQFCRQLWYELGEVYSEILNIKLDKINKSAEKPTPHALKKINMLCEKSIENYDNFLDSVKDKNGKMPRKLEYDIIRPVISAYAFIGRNSMKRIALDKSMQLNNIKQSYESYQSVVDICKSDEEAAAMMAEEFNLCQEMANILPIKIKMLESVQVS
ncbi:unnamed protein product, partial [Iphiclides podalirius]